MNLQDRYDELDLIIREIDYILDEITDKNYKEQLELIKFDAQDELEELEPKLQEMYEKEEKQQGSEYWREAI